MARARALSIMLVLIAIMDLDLIYESHLEYEYHPFRVSIVLEWSIPTEYRWIRDPNQTITVSLTQPAYFGQHHRHFSDVSFRRTTVIVDNQQINTNFETSSSEEIETIRAMPPTQCSSVVSSSLPPGMKNSKNRARNGGSYTTTAQLVRN